MSDNLRVTAYGMYNWPEAIEGLNPFWAALHQGLRREGFSVKNTIEKDRDAYDVWLDPELLLSQTCGFPYVTRLRDQVKLVATPHYAVQGCEGPFYRSVILKRCSDTRQTLKDFSAARAAVNSFRSQSGCNALLGTLVREGVAAPFLKELVKSGSHRRSMEMVVTGCVDICAIDAVCWRLMQDFVPDIARQLCALTWSDAQCGLPFITSIGTSESEVLSLRKHLQEALSTAGSGVAGCYISGFSVLSDSDYQGITAMADAANAAGFGCLVNV